MIMLTVDPAAAWRVAKRAMTEAALAALEGRPDAATKGDIALAKRHQRPECLFKAGAEESV